MQRLEIRGKWEGEMEKEVKELGGVQQRDDHIVTTRTRSMLLLADGCPLSTSESSARSPEVQRNKRWRPLVPNPWQRRRNPFSSRCPFKSSARHPVLMAAELFVLLRMLRSLGFAGGGESAPS